MRNADMMTPNADAPAHPIHELAGDPTFHGLTKREYFSALAMQAMLSNPKVDEFRPVKGDHKEFMATLAVKAADALLAELERSQ